MYIVIKVIMESTNHWGSGRQLRRCARVRRLIEQTANALALPNSGVASLVSDARTGRTSTADLWLTAHADRRIGETGTHCCCFRTVPNITGAVESSFHSRS